MFNDDQMIEILFFFASNKNKGANYLPTLVQIICTQRAHTNGHICSTLYYVFVYILQNVMQKKCFLNGTNMKKMTNNFDLDAKTESQ